MGIRKYLRGAVLFLIFLATAGCGGMLFHYRDIPAVSVTKYADVYNYSSDAVNPEKIDVLFEDVMRCFSLKHDEDAIRPTIFFTSPAEINLIPQYSNRGEIKKHIGFYDPRSASIFVPYFRRLYLGHELAHYVTQIYLHMPYQKSEWEAIAEKAEFCMR